jgi:hypothetical protein
VGKGNIPGLLQGMPDIPIMRIQQPANYFKE